MRRLLSFTVLGLAIVCGAAVAQAPVIELTAGFHRIEAEVVADNPSRMQGLMNRRSMASNHGMLFVFAFVDQHCMWMRNTLLPLSVAFLDESGRIINVEEMLPQTEDNHCAAAPARYALEMNRGWFSSRGLKAGSRIGGIDKAPQGR